MDDNSKHYTREEYVFLSKLYEKAERYNDMVNAIKSFISLDPCLTQEERMILSAGYKNLLTHKKDSWRLMTTLLKKEDKPNPIEQQYLVESKLTLEKEILALCDDMHFVIDKYLLPNTEDIRAQVFYYKLKGDYHRYRCEYLNGSELDKVVQVTQKAYVTAMELANSAMDIINPIRLGLVLNYCVFQYEIHGKKPQACEMARASLNEVMNYMEEIEKEKMRDTLMLFNILKENLFLWESEISEDGHV